MAWVGALACSYFGAALSGSTGWHVHPSHFAERYGLVLIIALGEAFIAIGTGATGTGIGLGEVVAAVLGLLVATSFWLAYFDFFAIRGERLLGDARGPERVALARDAYTYLHFPMIVGIVLFAFAMKTIVGHVGNELDLSRRSRSAAQRALPADSYSVIRIRIERRWRVSCVRLVAALLLLLLLPVATMVPALAAPRSSPPCGWLATYELVWRREARAESRSMLASP